MELSRVSVNRVQGFFLPFSHLPLKVATKLLTRSYLLPVNLSAGNSPLANRRVGSLGPFVQALGANKNKMADGGDVGCVLTVDFRLRWGSSPENIASERKVPWFLPDGESSCSFGRTVRAERSSSYIRVATDVENPL